MTAQYKKLAFVEFRWGKFSELLSKPFQTLTLSKLLSWEEENSLDGKIVFLLLCYRQYLHGGKFISACTDSCFVLFCFVFFLFLFLMFYC